MGPTPPVSRAIDDERTALVAENAVLARELATAQRRCSRIVQGQAQRIAALEAQVMRLRAELIRRDSVIDALRSDRCNAAALVAVASPSVVPPLRDRAVLCVGKRSAAVPLYRHTVEQTGARFLHHDGGAEDDLHRLEASLSLADVVICQTGCLSHDAHWRVQDHCRRFGKRCVFVETPSRSRLRHALDELAGDGAALVDAIADGRAGDLP